MAIANTTMPTATPMPMPAPSPGPELGCSGATVGNDVAVDVAVADVVEMGKVETDVMAAMKKLDVSALGAG